MSGSSSLQSFLTVMPVGQNCTGKEVLSLLCTVIASLLDSESGLTHKFITGICFCIYTTAYRRRGKVTVSKGITGWLRHFSLSVRNLSDKYGRSEEIDFPRGKAPRL